MLASGVLAGIAAGIAFGGDWRRLSTLTLRLWPLLVLAALARAATFFDPNLPLWLYLAGYAGIALVAAANWGLPGAALIAVGTTMNMAAISLNSGMPYDPALVASVGARIPSGEFYVILDASTRLPFFADVVPIGPLRGVYSVGDLLIALGGFLIPFMWLQPTPQADATRHQLRSTNFALFWLAQVISKFGDPITVIALTFATYRLTQSALVTALAVATATIPNAVFGFVGGAVADAIGTRRAMLWSDITRVALVALIPPLLAAEVPLVYVFVLAFLSGIAGAIFNPARAAIVPALISRERLAAANSLVFASDRAVEIVGALAAGVFVATVGDAAFYLDALTFAVSAVLLSRLVVIEEPRSFRWSALLGDVGAGLSFLRASTVLWSNTVFSLIAQVANPVINTLAPVLLVRRFAGNDAAMGAVLFGGSEAAIALGAVVGSAVLPGYIGRLRKGRALITGFLLTGAMIIAIAAAPTYPVAVALFAVLGFTNVLFYVPTVTILQEFTPQEMTARVFGARYALTNLSWLPVIFLGGYVGDLVGVDVLIAAAGAITLVAALAATLVPSIRDVP